MDPRTRHRVLRSLTSPQKENMGSFLSSSSSETKTTGNTTETHHQEPNVLSEIADTNLNEIVQQERTSRTELEETSKRKATPEGKLPKRPRKSPARRKRDKIKAGKLRADTPRPPRIPGQVVSSSQVAPQTPSPSGSKQKVLFADRPDDPGRASENGLEGTRPYRKGTPHPQRKRWSACSKTLCTDGESGDSKVGSCAPGDVRRRLETSTTNAETDSAADQSAPTRGHLSSVGYDLCSSPTSLGLCSPLNVCPCAHDAQQTNDMSIDIEGISDSKRLSTIDILDVESQRTDNATETIDRKEESKEEFVFAVPLPPDSISGSNEFRHDDRKADTDSVKPDEDGDKEDETIDMYKAPEALPVNEENSWESKQLEAEADTEVDVEVEAGAGSSLEERRKRKQRNPQSPVRITPKRLCRLRCPSDHDHNGESLPAPQ